MKWRNIVTVALVGLAGAVAGAGVVTAWPAGFAFISSWMGLPHGVNGADAEKAASERKILYWVAPMDPNYRRDGPGKSPMGMDLIPVYESEASTAADDDPSTVKITPQVINNLSVRKEPVQRGELSREIETVGYVDYDESKVSHVHLRAKGWIERLLVKSAGERVRQGQTLFEFYAPALANAQAELLQAYATGQDKLIEASWQRLQALAVPDDQMQAVVAGGKVLDRVRFYAPRSGVVTHLSVAEGMYVKPATNVMTLADLSSVWLLVHVFDHQAEWLAVGLEAEVSLPYAPGHTWQGQIEYIYPEVDPKTRTLRARLKFANPGERLKPNMFAEVTIYATPKTDALSVPQSAVIRTGTSDTVIQALEGGKFRPRKIVTGMVAGERVEILEGLEEGDSIVASAQFLIDSESSLSASFERMRGPESVSTGDMSAPDASGHGVINRLVPGERRVNLTHGPIPEINWPEMTMDFLAADDVDLDHLGEGDSVMFDLKKQDDGNYVIVDIDRMN